MKKTTRFIALVCAILMMLCLCACGGMSKSECMVGQAKFNALADDMGNRDIKYTVDYSRSGDLDIMINVPKSKGFTTYDQQFDLATKKLLLLAVDIFALYAANNGIALDDITVKIVDADGVTQYKAVNGNIVKTPW